MQEGMAAAVGLPKGMPVVRHKPRPTVELPNGMSEMPLFDQETPASQQIQEHWIAHVDVFTDLSDAEQAARYAAIWQKICDGLGVPSKDGIIERFDENTGKFVALLRWSEMKYKVPSDKG